MEQIVITAKIIIKTKDSFEMEDQRLICLLRLEQFLNTMGPVYLEQKLHLRFHFDKKSM